MFCSFPMHWKQRHLYYLASITRNPLQKESLLLIKSSLTKKYVRQPWEVYKQSHGRLPSFTPLFLPRIYYNYLFSINRL